MRNAPPIRGAPNSIPISLGPRILRAETAALAALAALMADRRRLAALLTHKSELLARVVARG